MINGFYGFLLNTKFKGNTIRAGRKAMSQLYSSTHTKKQSRNRNLPQVNVTTVQMKIYKKFCIFVL